MIYHIIYRMIFHISFHMSYHLQFWCSLYFWFHIHFWGHLYIWVVFCFGVILLFGLFFISGVVFIFGMVFVLWVIFIIRVIFPFGVFVSLRTCLHLLKELTNFAFYSMEIQILTPEIAKWGTCSGWGRQVLSYQLCYSDLKQLRYWGTLENCYYTHTHTHRQKPFYYSIAF